MQNQTEHLQAAVDRVRRKNTAKTGELERELQAVRREFFALHQNYLELGVRASRLAAERDTTLKNLTRTEAYIATLATVGAADTAGSQPPPAEGLAGADSLDAAPTSTLLAGTPPFFEEEPHSLRKAVETIKEYFTPADRLLKTELATLDRELSQLGNAYLELVGQVNTLGAERDEAIEKLREAQEFIDSRFSEGDFGEPAGAAEPDANRLSNEKADALAATLARTQAEKSDLEIALAERDDQISTLLAQEQQLREETSVLTQRLVAVEDQHQADIERAQALENKLQELASLQANIGNRDQQRINQLEQRLAQHEPQLEAAQRKTDDLKVLLAESSNHRVFAEQRLRLIEQEREKQHRQQNDRSHLFRAQPENPSQSIAMPADALVREVSPVTAVASSERHTRHPRPAWLKIAGSFAVLVLVLVGLAKIREVGDQIAGGSGELAGLEAQDARIDNSQAKDADQAAPAPANAPPATDVASLAKTAILDLDAQADLERRCRGKGLDGPACGLLSLNMFQGSVIRLPGDVQYSVVSNGTGISPEADDVVLVQYRGMLLDGTEFDSSGRRGGAISFRVDEAISGLQYVLRHMEEGARWEVYVPAELAYRKPALFGGQPVAFDIELISVVGSGIGSAQTGAPVIVPGVVVASQHASTNANVVQEPPGWQTAEAETQAFLQGNAEREGAISLPSGLQYRVLQGGYGRGRSPQATDTVTLHYRGLLPDGSEFESSYADIEPVTFSMQDVIPGWYEALSQMEEGAKWQLVIPPELAHSSEVTKLGTLGLQPLIYELELVSIN